MTIHSDWVRVFKEEVPHAFKDAYPFQGSPKIAYIDGMPLLMACERNVHTWEDLLRCNFARHVNRYFKLGCHAVVLAFDDYERVPAAKAITQANRTKKKAAYEFGEGQQLPPTMPDKYNEKLSNRVFKRRVIDMVCNRVLEHLAVNTSDAYTRSFVVDYTGCPIVFQAAKGAGRFDASSPTFMTDVPPMGEADIKFTRWLDHFPGDMVAFSVDGDFIPIALMRREAECNRVHASGSSHAAPPRNVAIYRLRYRMPVPAAARIKGGRQAGAATASAKKGTLKGQNTHAPQDGSGAAAANPPARQKHAREYEYVSIPVLYAGMRDVFERLGTRTSILTGRMRKSYMRMLAVLIGLGGTDFSRGLPLIGPYTLWELLVGNPNAFSNLLQLYSTKRGLVRVKCACNGMACNLYMLKFASHFGGGKVKGAKGSVPPAAATNRGVMDKFLVKKGADGGKIEIVSDDDDDGGDGSSEGEEEVDSDSESFRGGFQAMANTLKRNSSLSPKTLEMLPTMRRVDATFRNINWLLQYWACTPPVRTDEAAQQGQANVLWDYTGCYPHPVCEEYGFKYRKSSSPGKKRARSASKDDDGSAAKKKRGDKMSAGMCAVQWLDEGEDSSSCQDTDGSD